ncbi:hypothetical protein RRG08_018389 [Elysia crispata]|uniref:Uncharacterized protein n=1 Tax=Elysia crispata TaxID=231223 RepID=A0AAE1DWJ6_9GAST|nr:hypothetical protein RRG08_018389 [Elysia crispata]
MYSSRPTCISFCSLNDKPGLKVPCTVRCVSCQLYITKPGLAGARGRGPRLASLCSTSRPNLTNSSPGISSLAATQSCWPREVRGQTDWGIMGGTSAPSSSFRLARNDG